MKLVHVIPNFHNPAGCTLSAAKRERLVELAAEHGFWIFEDDPYRELPFEDAPSADDALAGRVGPGDPRVVVLEDRQPGCAGRLPRRPRGARSRTLAKRANELYISPNMLAESVVWELCRSGAPRREHRVREGSAARARRDALVAALREQLPEAEFVVPGGGYFLWLTLDDDVDARELLAAALEEGVAFVAGPDFMLEGGRSSLRLSFASVPPDQIGEGVARISRALERVRAASPGLIAALRPTASSATFYLARYTRAYNPSLGLRPA